MRIKKNIRRFLYFMIFLLSWRFVTHWRTTEFGLSADTISGQLLTTSISIFPLSLVALIVLELIGYNWQLKRFVAHMLVIAVLVIVLSEIWASSEEHLFKKRCTANTSGTAQDVWQVRWWPFTGNSLGYHNGVFHAQE